MKKRLFQVTLALFFAAAGFGCSKKIVKTDSSAIATENKTAATSAPAASSDNGQRSAESKISENSISSGPASKSSSANTLAGLLLDVYFDFDRYTIRADSQKILEKDAGVLKNSGQAVTIEGRCDERGSDEYNLVLGERRAAAVKNYLKDLGVAPDRITTVSYGNEKPFCLEHNEACWQKNRTAHFTGKD